MVDGQILEVPTGKCEFCKNKARIKLPMVKKGMTTGQFMYICTGKRCIDKGFQHAER